MLEAEEKATPGAPGLIAEAQGILDELHALRWVIHIVTSALTACCHRG